MRKTNRNLNKIKLAKALIVFFLVQLCLIVAFALINRSHAPLDLSNVKKETIVVDEVTYEYLSGGHVTLFSNSKEYVFPKYPVAGTREASMWELYEVIEKGDSLTVEYMEKTNRNGAYRLTLSVYKGDQPLRTEAAYSKFLAHQRTLGVITFGIVELFFFVILAFFLIIWHRRCFSVPNRKK